jgi:hypothetical protein
MDADRSLIVIDIQQNLRGARARLLEAIADDAEQLGRVPGLPEFLERHQLDPDDLYRRDTSWSRLCVEASLTEPFQEPDESRLTKGLRRIEHISGPRQIAFLMEVLDCHAPLPSPEHLSAQERRWLAMLHFSMWGPGETMDDEIASLRQVGADGICSDAPELL